MWIGAFLLNNILGKIKKPFYLGVSIWSYLFILGNAIYFNLFSLQITRKLLPSTWRTYLNMLLPVMEKLVGMWGWFLVAFVVVWSIYWLVEQIYRPNAGVADTIIQFLRSFTSVLGWRQHTKLVDR